MSQRQEDKEEVVERILRLADHYASVMMQAVMENPPTRLGAERQAEAYRVLEVAVRAAL